MTILIEVHKGTLSFANVLIIHSNSLQQLKLKVLVIINLVRHYFLIL